MRFGRYLYDHPVQLSTQAPPLLTPKPLNPVPDADGSKTPPGTVTPLLPWATYSDA